MNEYRGIIALEKIFPSIARRAIAVVFNLGILLFLIPVAYSAILKFLPTIHDLPIGFPASSFWLGLLYIFIAVRLIILALDSFFNSKTDNVTRYLLALDYDKNPAWRKFLSRLGIEERELPQNVNYSNIEGASTFTESVVALFQNQSLKNFLAEKNLKPEDVDGAALWSERETIEDFLSKRWWKKDHLARLQGLGKNFAYGETYYLERFAFDLSPQAESLKEEILGKNREIELIEKALMKVSGANALIVGEAGVGKHTLLLALTREIAEGRIFPDLEHKQVFKLYAESIIASGKTKGDAEAILMKLLNETIHAGNIILAIDNFPEFIESLSTTGINALEILSPYLSHPDMHIIALADKTSARKILEPNAALMKFFERVDIEEPSREAVIEILEDEALKLEKSVHGRFTLTYQTIEKVATVAEQNLVEGAMPKRAIDLLRDLFSEGISRAKVIMEPDIVLELVSRKTKMPLGEIKQEERNKLLDLENIFSSRVIGQKEATDAVANAVRRIRAGIESRQKPLASFLFMGPTGVGKTETAKALAFIYFESEENMVRFDMSEYSSEDSMSRLQEFLGSKILAEPYAVVLLDEFEKSHPKIRNLFLQILDEGYFTDQNGRKVNMRNTIVIATSNSVNPGADFKPELLNRFDSIIIFKPLGENVRGKIAEKALNNLKERLERENYLLKITPPLIDAVAKGGYDPKMGARPMQRYIQDKIEKIISEKIIRGQIRAGREFEIIQQELN